MTPRAGGPHRIHAVPFYILQFNVWVTAKIDGVERRVSPLMFNTSTGDIIVAWPTGHLPGEKRQRHEVRSSDYVPENSLDWARARLASTPASESEADVAAAHDKVVKGMRDAGLDTRIADLLLMQPQDWKAQRFRGEPVKDVVDPYIKAEFRREIHEKLFGELLKPESRRSNRPRASRGK